MADTDLRDFACSGCGAWLPDIPAHGERGTYCSAHCRQWAEGDPEPDTEDDIPPCPFDPPAAWNPTDGWRQLREVPF